MVSRRFLLVGIVVAGLLGGVLVGPPPSERTGTPPEDQLVRPGDAESHVWPYTSRSRSVDGRTLALNVVVHGSPERVRVAFERRSDANWTSTAPDETVDGVIADGLPWRSAHGAARYTYVTADPNATGQWVESEYQLATGTYLGHRTHIRAYPSPLGDWTALQAHVEYWDWFRLRHTVTGVASGALFVERDLRDEPFVAGVSRVYHGLDGGGSEGWISVVQLATLAVVAGVALPVGRRRFEPADIALPVSVAAVVLGVRAAGLAAESVFPAANPKLFAAVLYPILAGGPVLAAFVLARGRPAARIGLLAAVGLGVGLVLDMTGVGVQVVRIRFVLHRLALVGAIGLFAYGVGRDERRTMATGLGAWFVALVLPLIGLI